MPIKFHTLDSFNWQFWAFLGIHKGALVTQHASGIGRHFINWNKGMFDLLIIENYPRYLQNQMLNSVNLVDKFSVNLIDIDFSLVTEIL